MKKLLITLSIFLSISVPKLYSQTDKTTSTQTTSLDAKSKFISNQDYLSSSTLKDYKNFYGDSLKGFNEAGVKAELTSRLFHGQEFINVMSIRKRDYVDQKYKLGRFAPKQSSAVVQTKSNKPIGGSGASINGLPCINEDFESTNPGTYNTSNAVSGWTVESTSSSTCQVACNQTPIWIPGSPEFSIVTTPIIGHPYIGNLGASPLGGTNVAVLNDVVPGFTVTRMSTTFPVNTQNSLFQFAYAGSWDGSGHLCCDQPFFTINMFDCNGVALGCSSLSLTPSGPSCQNGVNGYSVTGGGISWTNWQIKYIDLTPYIGSCVTMQVVNGDCTGGAHHGSLYFDAKCGGSILCGNCSPPNTNTVTIGGPVSYCAGSGLAQIAGPVGYATYSWVAPASGPTLSASMSTMQIISITNPVANSVYTLYLTSFSGCQFISTNTISTSAVNIAGIGSVPSCLGGASGTATVVGNGSGTGYNYTWLNSTNSVVSTASLATGLSPGIYSVIITGLGAAGCGSAVATTTIGTAPQAVRNILTPYCGTVVPIVTNGGSNFQWYNGTSAITPSLGGNSPSITILNPPPGQIITLTYLSNLGCQDSIRYNLAPTNPGFLMATGITSVCLNGTNGSAQINLGTAQNAPAGFNYIHVMSTGTTPAYISGTSGGTATSLPLTGMSAGSYSVNAFDGSCYYNTTFTVNTHVFSYTLSQTSPTLCPGGNIPIGLNFGFPQGNLYTYQWSPSTWLTGSTSANVIISPTVTPGTQQSIVYSVVVTPTVINCPLTKTVMVTGVNPAIPSFSVIPALCNTSTAFQILASPPGGTFATNFTGTASPVSVGGIITPSNTNIVLGTNTFTYSTSVYTCAASNTGTYEVSQFRSAALSSPIPPLCVTNSPFNLMTVVQGTAGGGWNGTNVSSNQFSPANLLTGIYSLTYSRTSTPNMLACPSVSTTTVAVTNTLIPTITQQSEFCTNATPFLLSANPAGGGWSASMGIGNNGLVTPVNITTPSLTVTYTLADGPCLDMNTTVLHISKFVPATLNGIAPDFCYSTPPFNLMSIVLNTSGTWTGANGISNNSFFPAGLATNSYELTYHTTSIPNALLCPDTKTLIVSVLNPAQPVINPVATLCNNANPFQLSVSPNTGQWTNTSYLSGSGLFSPALSSVGSNNVQYSIGTSTCNRQQNLSISVEAFVPATIITTIPDLCNNSPVINLTPFTLNTSGHWSGQGISGNNFNPAITGAGNITLQYNTASSPSGLCPDVASISVNVFSLATPIVSQAGPFCNSSLPIQLKVNPIGGLFGGFSSGLVSANGVFNPAFGNIGENLITYSITSGPCKAYAQTLIKVEKFISAAFNKSVGPFCKTDVPVNLNSYVQNQGGTWSTKGGAPGLNGSLFNPNDANSGNSTVLVYTTHSQPGEANCPDLAEMRVEIRNAPKAAVTKSAGDGCAPLKVEFNSPYTNIGRGLWTIGDGSESQNSLNMEHTFVTPGAYKIQFNYSDDLGCKADEVITEVLVYDSPKADFNFPEEIYITDPKVQIVNLTSDLDNNLYSWKIKEVYQGTDLSPVVMFPAIGKYQVTLIATSLTHCSSEVSKTIEIKNNYNVFIPNSFTPNFDGLNDYFIPTFTKEGVDAKGFDMKIYNRWGHLIYQTNDMTKGWDGSLENKGEPLQEGVYVFKIKYKDSEGQTFEKIGNVSLLK